MVARSTDDLQRQRARALRSVSSMDPDGPQNYKSMRDFHLARFGLAADDNSRADRIVVHGPVTRIRRPYPDPTWANLVPFLNDIDKDIVRLHNTRPIKPTVTFLKDVHEPQLKAAAVAVNSLTSRFKGLIMADPPGLGKTIAALAAIHEAHRKGYGPSVVVVPSSCTLQWMNEVSDFFPKGTMPALRLQEGYVSPAELSKYKIIVTSYSYVTAEYVRLRKFLRARQDFDSGIVLSKPRRPRICLLSSFARPEAAAEYGTFMVLDEAHAIKNTFGHTYAAIRELRKSFEACLLLTATPMDNSWIDSFALLSLLKGHPIIDLHRMREAFSSAYTGKYPNYDAVPVGKYLPRFAQMMDAVTLIRPPRTDLPKITHYKVPFRLSEETRHASNTAFGGFTTANTGPPRPPSATTDRAKLTSLIRAEQLIFHPMLVEVLPLERAALEKSLAGDDTEDAQLNSEEARMFASWRSRMAKGDNWRSPRVEAIVALVLHSLDRQPDDGILIIDESIYFLDIIEIALSKVPSQAHFFRFDGRSTPEHRNEILQSFVKKSGPRVMLASRHTGGQGLNVHPAANVLIRCSPWWRSSWADQGNGRIKRFGQKKTMMVYEVVARPTVDVEAYKQDVHQRNYKVNESVLRLIRRGEDEEVGPRRHIT